MALGEGVCRALAGGKVSLIVLAGVFALGLAGLAWAVETASSEEQQDAVGDSEWTLVVGGLVESPLSLTFGDLAAMPTTTVFAELYCVGQPTIPLEVGDWTGVRLGFMLGEAGVLPEAWKVAFYADKKLSILDIMEYSAFGQYGKNCPYGL